MIEGLRILCSREFWDDFRDYWSPASVAERIDAFAERLEDLRRRD